MPAQPTRSAPSSSLVFARGLGLTRPPAGGAMPSDAAVCDATTTTLASTVICRPSEKGSLHTLTEKRWAPAFSLPAGRVTLDSPRYHAAGPVPSSKHGSPSSRAQDHQYVNGVGLPLTSRELSGSEVDMRKVTGAALLAVRVVPPTIAASTGDAATWTVTSAVVLSAVLDVSVPVTRNLYVSPGCSELGGRYRLRLSSVRSYAALSLPDANTGVAPSTRIHLKLILLPTVMPAAAEHPSAGRAASDCRIVAAPRFTVRSLLPMTYTSGMGNWSLVTVMSALADSPKKLVTLTLKVYSTPERSAAAGTTTMASVLLVCAARSAAASAMASPLLLYTPYSYVIGLPPPPNDALASRTMLSHTPILGAPVSTTVGAGAGLGAESTAPLAAGYELRATDTMASALTTTMLPGASVALEPRNTFSVESSFHVHVGPAPSSFTVAASSSAAQSPAAAPAAWPRSVVMSNATDTSTKLAPMVALSIFGAGAGTTVTEKGLPATAVPLMESSTV
mmetsp:Transcript_24198/g.82623  ORF Transcript_24198/g.82623 Transcript_24198/m.82623 type:complete len:506 (-) Transcript_24198:12566-14083(-)